MNASRCVTLLSCRSQELSYYFTYNTAEVDNIVNLAGIGNVIQISDPLHFAEQYYTITNVCDGFSAAVECVECVNSTNRINDDAGTLVQFWTTTQFGDVCPNLARAYVLVNCRSGYTFVDPRDIEQSQDTAIVSSTDMTAYVGMVVNVAEYPGICFTVLGPYTERTGCPCDEHTILTAYPDCECCYPPVNQDDITCCDIPQSKQKPFKKFYHIVDSECEVRDNKTFANAYYKLFNQVKNGIQNCCSDINFEKLWIKKELSDYSRINPDDQCIVVIPAVVVPCDGPDPLPPGPLGCAPVANVSTAGFFTV